MEDELASNAKSVFFHGSGCRGVEYAVLMFYPEVSLLSMFLLLIFYIFIFVYLDLLQKGSEVTWL